MLYHPSRLVHKCFPVAIDMSFQIWNCFSGSQAQVKTTSLYHRSEETYPSEYETGIDATFVKYFYQNKIYKFI